MGPRAEAKSRKMVTQKMIFKDYQPMVWERLLRAKSNNRVGSAYLFTGSRGCGKEWGAIEFAKLLNCENASGTSCNRCPSCAKFVGLQHPNLKLIVPLPGSDKSTKSSNPLDALKKEDLEYLTEAIARKGSNPFYKIMVPAARRITINSIRDLRKTIYLKSQSNGQKIVLILDAHLLSAGMGESANALLKILEEPPPNTTLILVSDKKSALLPTIISRCQPINFPALNLDQTRLILENDGIENEQATQIALVAKGDVHLAKEISSQSTGKILAEAEALSKLMTRVNENGWREFINSNAMLAARKPQEFKFRVYLLQLWFHQAYELRTGEAPNGILPGMTESLQQFNDTYPVADLAGINKILEETVESLVRNLYTPLTLTNLLISVQELLKGKIPISVA
jgi:DNA polymerase-3 subunit delta'